MTQWGSLSYGKPKPVKIPGFSTTGSVGIGSSLLPAVQAAPAAPAASPQQLAQSYAQANDQLVAASAPPPDPAPQAPAPLPPDASGGTAATQVAYQQQAQAPSIDSNTAAQQAQAAFNANQTRERLARDSGQDKLNYEEALRRLTDNQTISSRNQENAAHKAGLFFTGTGAADADQIRTNYTRQRADALQGYENREFSRQQELNAANQQLVGSQAAAGIAGAGGGSSSTKMSADGSMSPGYLDNPVTAAAQAAADKYNADDRAGLHAVTQADIDRDLAFRQALIAKSQQLAGG
ncbi:hypothetical protein NBH00_05170 [Paraconexibacter antarcticus]|uniref:SprA family protein n=1 Tax=Paraconexibacter antarcticus TaxID=2949664 RepID=A0ABY5DUA5_9ACTN|nr:hypothetical protein [Paraconexibacter antarcticus]UTI65601.1 hypothetical protein NBH00_05170 [Paraconexibacter antarcticus]